MRNEAWTKGLAALVLAFPEREMKPETQKARGDLYRKKLDDLTDEQWLRAVNACLERETYFPAIAVLRRYAKPPEAEALAAAAFEAVVECREYRPTGSIWNARVIRDKLGPAASEAFVAAGGHAAFSCLGERSAPFVRKAFVEAYLAAVLAAPKLALPAPKTPELLAAEESPVVSKRAYVPVRDDV